jgi:hypothetical protein
MLSKSKIREIRKFIDDVHEGSPLAWKKYKRRTDAYPSNWVPFIESAVKLRSEGKYNQSVSWYLMLMKPERKEIGFAYSSLI